MGRAFGDLAVTCISSIGRVVTSTFAPTPPTWGHSIPPPIPALHNAEQPTGLTQAPTVTGLSPMAAACGIGVAKPSASVACLVRQIGYRSTVLVPVTLLR